MLATILAGMGSAASPAAHLAEPQAVADQIDRRVAARWAAKNVRPAPASDDAEFLRRVSLDLIGRIPTVAEARAFLADRSVDKRSRLIDRLLDQPGYATHFARFWRERWLPQSAAQFEELKPDFEEWLRQRLRANAPYDRMVRDLLRVPDDPAARAAPPGDRRSLAVFLQANEFKPANLAGTTARMFLGVNLDCAQCHDHPFARWTRNQFWEYAAFFADPSAARGKGLGLTIPGVSRTVTPHYLDGTAPHWSGEPDAIAGRAALAGWITAPANPYFARNAVNQVWAYLFGAGLVEPLDDLSGVNPPSHPELLDELAKAFVASGYDVKFLLQAVTRSRAYQLSSADPGGPVAPPNPPLFVRASVRAMSGDQLYDSLCLAAGFDETGDAGHGPPGGMTRGEFLARFGRSDRPTQAGRTILQSLLFMNGGLVFDATDLRTGRTLAAVADAPFLDTSGRVEALYLAALSRRPRPDESQRLTAFVDGGGPAHDPRRALATAFWAL